MSEIEAPDVNFAFEALIEIYRQCSLQIFSFRAEPFESKNFWTRSGPGSDPTGSTPERAKSIFGEVAPSLVRLCRK